MNHPHLIVRQMIRPVLLPALLRRVALVAKAKRSQMMVVYMILIQ